MRPGRRQRPLGKPGKSRLEARAILGELRNLTSSLAGRQREVSPGHEEHAQEPPDARQPSWMVDGPAQLPSEMAPEKLKPTPRMAVREVLGVAARTAADPVLGDAPYGPRGQRKAFLAPSLGFRYLRTGFIEPSDTADETERRPDLASRS